MTRFLIATTIGILWPIALSLLKSNIIEEKFENKTRFFLVFSSIGAISALIGPSRIAFSFSIVWAICCLVAAAYFAIMFLKQKSFNPVEIARVFAPAFVAFGAIWLVAANIEYRLLGFSDTIVLLTAAHFHAAGGCLTALTVLNAERLQSRFARLICLFAVIAIPTTAIGIELGGTFEFIGASFTVLAGILLAVSLMMRKQSDLIKMHRLRIISAISLFVAMGLASAFSFQHLGYNLGISIDFMVYTHAMLNTFGFIGLGLASFHPKLAR